jgi:hypothetical protein
MGWKQKQKVKKSRVRIVQTLAWNFDHCVSINPLACSVAHNFLKALYAIHVYSSDPMNNFEKMTPISVDVLREAIKIPRILELLV